MGKRYFFVLCIMLMGAAARAQFSITGNVRSTAPLANMVITLLHAKDSAFAKTIFSDANGKFEFEQVKEGAYLVMVAQQGLEKYISETVTVSPDQPVAHVKDIQLVIVASGLQEVKVIARKPFVEKKIDRVVVNPDALISNAGATSLEALEKAPGILVDINGNISLKGKPGVMVFIDDKPTYMTSADLASYLRSLPAGSVESFEIMTNPPARYDAAGNAGVINIRLKKNRVKGINGGINLAYGQGRYHRTNNSFNINYRVNKFNFFGNVGVSDNNSYQDLTINRFYYLPDGTFNSRFTQNSYFKKEQQSFNARIGADYYASDKTTFGVTLAGFLNPSRSPVTNSAVLTDKDDEIVSLVEASNPSKRKWKNGSVNLNYAKKLNKKGREISANADYIKYNSSVSQNLVNDIYLPDGTLQNSSILRSSLPADIGIQSVKFDYVSPLSKGGKMDMGVKSSFVQTDNTADFFDVVNNIPEPNYEFSNRFKYKENINAAYVNFAKDWKRFSIQAGLRLENTNIDGHQLGNPMQQDSSFKRDYTSLFPTFYILYKLDSVQKHQLGFSAGRRINRPDYQALNPFTYPIDRFTFYGGNPFLEPTFSYNFEISHTYKNKITTTLEYGIANNLIQETNEQRGNIYYSRPGNFGKQISYGIDVNATLPVKKSWTLQLYTELKNLTFKSDVYGQKLDEGRFYWYVGPTNQFIISKNLSAELAGSYQTRILVGQFLTIPVWQVRAGLSQKIIKDKGALRLNVSDIFYTNQPGGDIRNIADSKANWLSLLDSRVVTIAFSYRFNKGKSLNARQSGASDSEKGRVKTS